MSRKANIEETEKDDWATVKIFVSSIGYSPYKPDKSGKLKNALVILHCDSTEKNIGSPFAEWGAFSQQLLLHHSNLIGIKHVVVVDATPITTKLETITKEDLFDEEAATAALDKRLSKPIAKILNKLLLQGCTICASGHLCPLLAKIVPASKSENHQLYSENIRRIIMIQPAFNARAVNAQLRGPFSTFVKETPLDLVFSSQNDSSKRLDVLRMVYPNGNVEVVNSGFADGLLKVLCGLEASHNGVGFNTEELTNALGEKVWFSKVSIEMNRYSKQYEQYPVDITEEVEELFIVRARKLNAQIFPVGGGDTFGTTELPDVQPGEEECGALVLRGNRCVLVRSLDQHWSGMRIPAVPRRQGGAHAGTEESQHDTALRAMAELCDIEPEEMECLDIPPVYLYPQPPAHPRGRGRIAVYAMYAVQPPPDGPLEDADIEDEEDCYDWYTFPRAIERLADINDTGSIDALRTMALAVHSAHRAGKLEGKWGGVFGQEWTELIMTLKVPVLVTEEELNNPSTYDHDHRGNRKGRDLVSVSGITLTASNAHDVSREALPVTVLSGFLGAGKTTLLQRILTNSAGLRVAVIVNDMADVNIDAAMLRQGAQSVAYREEKMVELTNGCICCTLREDLLVEISKLAAEQRYDYLVIESTGISEPLPVAETFTFKDDSGVSLSDVARLDTMVTVVDGFSFLCELSSIDTLKSRGMQAAEDDSRSMAQLLCDQVEFANVIVINKTELLSEEDIVRLTKVLQKMNPEAEVVAASFGGGFELERILNSRKFSFSAASNTPEWLKAPRLDPHRSPESDEYGISSFTFRALRPFHPARLYDLVAAWDASGTYPATVRNSVTATVATAATAGLFSNSSMLNLDEVDVSHLRRIVRAKGFAWLATRHNQQGVVSFAGRRFSISPGVPWWAALERSMWPAGLDEAIAPLWHEPHGDRQIELVVIGADMDNDAVKSIFERCLLSDEELQAGPEAWAAWLSDLELDPFVQMWDSAEDAMLLQASHDHDHDHHNHHDHDHHDHGYGCSGHSISDHDHDRLH